VNYKYRVGATGKRILKLVTILGTACIVWGFLTTSFFGISFDIDNPIRKVSLVQWLAEKKAAYMMKHKDQEWQDWVKKYPQVESAEDGKDFLRKGVTESERGKNYDILNKTQDGIMFELALLIGVVHIIISLLRYSDRNWTAYGWVAFLIGAYLYFPTFLNVTSIIHYVFGLDKEAAARNGMYLMIGGISFATIVAFIKHKWLGIFEPMTLIQIFADTMSYLRLYALGLSGSMLIATMYDLASGMNFVLAALIIIAGHVTNFVLCIMSGTIHGLRLNFLEWYHYSFEGGGKMFNPLRKLKTE
jgi:V/A-type H+-transporting ATPase subunit I